MNKKSLLRAGRQRRIRTLFNKEHAHVVDRMAGHYGRRTVSRGFARSLGFAGARGGASRGWSATGKLRPLGWQARVRWRQLRRSIALLRPIVRQAPGLAALGLLLIQLVMSASTMWIDRAMAARQNAVAADVVRLELDRDRLTIAVAQAADPAFMAVRARDVLHYAQPDEHLIVVTNAAPTNDTATPPWWIYE